MTTTSTQPILNYATPDQLSPTRQTLWLVRMFGVFQFLVGAGALIGATAMIVNDESVILISAPMMIAGAMHLAIGVLLFRLQPASWIASRAMLAILLLPALGFVVFGTVLFVVYHEAAGWDQLSAAVGVVMGAIASAPYWLNLITLWYLMRPHPRALFGVSVTDSFIGRKTFMRTMAALWVICVAVCLIAWIAP